MGSAPNGNLVTAIDNEVQIWDLAKEKVIHRLRRHEGGVLAVGFSPDGSRLFVLEGDSDGRFGGGGRGAPDIEHRLRVWDLATERELLVLPVFNNSEIVRIQGGGRPQLFFNLQIQDGRLHLPEEGGTRILDGSPAAK